MPRRLSKRVRTFDARRVKVPPKQVDTIYSDPRHKAWRAEVIKRAGGRCEAPDCSQPDRVGIRLFADHIKEVRDLRETGGDLFDISNGRALCGACHSAKTARVRAKRMGESFKTGGGSKV